MKVFTFFVEPGSYTLDLISNIHQQMGIDYIFLKNSSHTHSTLDFQVETMENKNILEQTSFLLETFKKNQLIIFNGYNYWQFMFLYILNLVAFGKKVIAIDSDTRYRKKKGIKGFLKKIYLTPVFSNKYILGFAGGNFVHKDLFRNYGMKEENIFLMPMMINNKKYYAPLPRKEEPFTFLFVGRMIPLKQIEFLIKSFLKNYEGNEKIQLKIVGGGELYEPLTQTYGHHANVIFTGPKYGQDLVQEYHTSNVLVLPSDREQWGLVINEAMAAGLPVIASDQVGAIYDLIIDKDTGFVFSLEKENDLADKMKRFVDDRELYKIYSRNAQKLLLEHWNYDLYRKNLQNAIERAKEILGEGTQ